ncbi:hypothetical protein MUK42_30292 [Musa troglodytarum]|uniref:Uncharacterized protein n=1 Tax=Musa troglodytarum TaxID=320322 RepID=A0A9E7FHW6_9LILI|nr:hypothetical protein MUK42_30292 [Musa troglodytarum]
MALFISHLILHRHLVSWISVDATPACGRHSPFSLFLPLLFRFLSIGKRRGFIGKRYSEVKQGSRVEDTLIGYQDQSLPNES